MAETRLAPVPIPDRPVFLWPTPNRADLLFYIWRDGKNPANKTWNYGDAYPIDPVTYPNHRLILVTPQAESKWSKWYYMAERADQDLYNWEHTQADIGGTKFDAVQRTYVTLREEFDPHTPAMGYAMPDIPEETFDAAYVLAQRTQKRGDPEFDSLFVTEQQVFVRKVTLTDHQIDPETGIASYAQTTLYYKGELASGIAIETLFADTANANGFWSSDAAGYGNEGKQLSETWFAVTRREVVNTDTLYEEESSKLRSSKFFCPQTTSVSTIITSNNVPGAPVTPVAAEGTSVTVTKRGRIQKRRTITQTGTARPIKGTRLDQRTGKTFLETQEQVLVADVAESEVDVNGTLIQYDPVDACFSVKSTGKLVSTDVETWVELMNYEWPPVLLSLTFSTWPKRKGGSVTYPKFLLKRGFHGPQAATVRQWWQKAAPTVVTPIQMVPEGVGYDCPFFSINIPPCLHGPLSFYCNTGTTDPVWEYAIETYNVAATNFTDWPAQVQWVESKPNLGGFLVTETTLNKPS